MRLLPLCPLVGGLKRNSFFILFVLVTFFAVNSSSSSSTSTSTSSLGTDADATDDEQLLICHPACDCLDAYFDCRKRGLDYFPQDFPYWVEKLNISNNEIRNVQPAALSRLMKLRSLSLDGNNLTAIPFSPAQLKDLVYLSLSRNGVVEVKAQELGSFKSLQEFDVSRNRIEALSNGSFPQNSSLHIISLAANQIEVLESGCLAGLVFLEELNLSRNRIKSIPKELFSFTKNLERLDLSRNKLEVLDSLRFQELKKLQSLNLRRNHITNLSDATFYGLDKLHSLFLDGNGIRVVEKRWLYGLRSLRTLNLSRNEVEKIEDDSWEYMDELTTLDLSFNKLVAVKKGSLKGLSRLRHLDLSHNHITVIEPETFLGTEKLESLDLSWNNLSWALEDMESPFNGLKDCTSLNLASNRLQTLHSTALKGLLSLKTLNLSSNPLKWLSPLTFEEFPYLILHLHAVQTFVCDCESTWLQSKLNTHQHSLTNSHVTKPKSRHRDSSKSILNQSKSKNSPICQFPTSLEGKTLTDISLQDLKCSDKHESRPRFTLEPKTQVLLLDGNGSLSCEAMASNSNNAIQIYWTKDYHSLPDHMISHVSNFERILTPNDTMEVNSILHLINVTWEDVGRYQCVAQNHLGISYSSKANVTVHIYPSFVKRPANVTVRLGSMAKLECGAKGYPPPEIAFQKDGGENVPAALDRRFHVMPNDDSFIIMDIKLIDMGEYCCSARNEAGEIRACASVTVYETPSFLSRMEDERVVEGSNTVLECESTGSPKPHISWSKDSVLIREGDEQSRIRIKDHGSFLIIKDVRLEDAGRYECLLSNAVGTARDFLSLTVIPSDSSALSDWTSPAMIYALVVIAALCVIATIVAWVLVICKDRRKRGSGGGGRGTGGGCDDTSCGGGTITPRRHSILRYEDLLEDSTLAHNRALTPTLGVNSVIHLNTSSGIGDSGSQSSSGKDSGTGEDLPPDLDHVGGLELEQESLMKRSWRKPELETFSTFGSGSGRGTVGSRFRLSQLNSKGPGNGGTDRPTCDVISLAHPPGREFLTMPRKVPMPVPPPFVSLLGPKLVEGNGSGFGSSSSSSGYSSLGGGVVNSVRDGNKFSNNPEKFEPERTESVISSNADSIVGGRNLLSLGGDCLSSTDGLSSNGNRDLTTASNSVCSDSEGARPPSVEPLKSTKVKTPSPVTPTPLSGLNIHDERNLSNNSISTPV